MPRNRSRSSPQLGLDSDESKTKTDNDVRPSMDGKSKRTATVYDAVAGRVGLAGFLTAEQRNSHSLLPSAPEDVLLRRIGAPDRIPYGYYDADERLPANQRLPDSDLLKAIHEYTSDFYQATSGDNSTADFRSFDETALLALGILLEEAAREVLGENGDMAMTEPEGLEHDTMESKMTRHQIVGRVVPRKLPPKGGMPAEDSGDELADEASPRKRRR